MKRYIQYAFAASVMLAAIVSCGKIGGDKEKDKTTDVSATLVGKWLWGDDEYWDFTGGQRCSRYYYTQLFDSYPPHYYYPTYIDGVLYTPSNTNIMWEQVQSSLYEITGGPYMEGSETYYYINIHFLPFPIQLKIINEDRFLLSNEYLFRIKEFKTKTQSLDVEIGRRLLGSWFRDSEYRDHEYNEDAYYEFLSGGICKVYTLPPETASFSNGVLYIPSGSQWKEEWSGTYEVKDGAIISDRFGGNVSVCFDNEFFIAPHRFCRITSHGRK